MQVKNKRLALSAPLTILMLVVALVLAACGDSTVTSTVAPTTAAATATTAKAATTAVATTAAPTTAVATTAAVGATTAAPTTAKATTVAATPAASNAVTIPAISGVTEVVLDTAIRAELIKQIPGLTNPTIKFYVSDDEAQKLADNADLALTGAGYAFGIPGQTKPAQQGDSISGFYVKTGSADILLAAGAVPANAGDLSKTLNIPGITADAAQKLVDQVKGKKSMLIIIAAPGLLQSLMGGAATAIASTAATGGGVVGESDIPVYTGAKRIDTASGSLGGLTSVYYLSGDDYDKIVTWTKTAFAAKGWTEVSTLDSGSGAAIVTGKKGGYSLLGTIVGPKAQGNANFDSVLKQANAGPNDTVIAIVVTNS